jgi:hypothetical protein
MSSLPKHGPGNGRQEKAAADENAVKTNTV